MSAPAAAQPKRCADHGYRPGSWKQTFAKGLVCVRCGVPWPGVPLPDPPTKYEGYGELAEQPSWASRVAAMTTELGEVA